MATNKKKPTVLVEVGHECLTIYIKELPHLFIKDQVIGFMSWIDGYGTDTMYKIQFYTLTKEFQVEYNRLHLWITILKELNKKIIKK